MTKPKLKPCPFCGHRVELSISEYNYAIVCNSCHIYSSDSSYTQSSDNINLDQFIEQWNNRPLEEKIKERGTKNITAQTSQNWSEQWINILEAIVKGNFMPSRSNSQLISKALYKMAENSHESPFWSIQDTNRKIMSEWEAEDYFKECVQHYAPDLKPTFENIEIFARCYRENSSAEKTDDENWETAGREFLGEIKGWDFVDNLNLYDDE